MAAQQIPLFLPPNYDPTSDYSDEYLMEIQAQYMQTLPYARPEEKNDETECPICLENLVFYQGRITRKRDPNSKYAAKLLCNHILCFTCANEHFIDRDFCPICKVQQFRPPRWTFGQRKKIRDHFDQYWAFHNIEVMEIMDTVPEPNRNNSFKNNTYQYDLTVLAVTYLNELLHASADSPVLLTHYEKMQYTMAVQDALQHWLTSDAVVARLSDRQWLPADNLDRVGAAKADFARGIAAGTAEFFSRARSVEFVVPVDNAELFRNLAKWLFHVNGLNPHNYDDWQNQMVLAMVHCLSHIVTHLDGIGWQRHTAAFQALGDFPPILLGQIRDQAADAVLQGLSKHYVNEGHGYPEWNGSSKSPNDDSEGSDIDREQDI